MGYIYKGIPVPLVTELQKASNISSFVETGTSRGNTALWASSRFKKVYTIEIAEAIYNKTIARPEFKNITNIKFLKGSSLDVLPGILPQLEDNAMFWLDGHYSGFDTGGADNECPVLDELKIVSQCKNAVVLIDDALCFLGPPVPPHNPAQWPRIDEVFATIHQYFPQHYTTLIDDVIVSVPQNLKEVLDKDWLENLNKRYKGPSFGKRTKNLIIKAAVKSRDMIKNKH